MPNFEIIEIDNPKWQSIVRSSYVYDFHHTAFYHGIDNDHRSVLLVATEDSDFLALPLVIRPIEGTDWYDATSVYGYGGAIANESFEVVTSSLVEYFKVAVKDFFLNNNIVSVFSRLHPLINSRQVFDGMGEVVNLNRTVAIDLTLPVEIQRRQYRKSNKSEINQLRRKGLIVEEATTRHEVERFIDIYYETMDRVDAIPYYYFSREYFHSFMENSSFDSRLLVAKDNGDIVAGAIFTITQKIMEYHLAGTVGEYIQMTPMKLIIDEARLLGSSLSLEYLHLGGGVGGSDDDSLFRFKSGFSDYYCQFAVWKYVVDENQYNQLVDSKSGIDKSSNFFPLYRA